MDPKRVQAHAHMTILGHLCAARIGAFGGSLPHSVVSFEHTISWIFDKCQGFSHLLGRNFAPGFIDGSILCARDRFEHSNHFSCPIRTCVDPSILLHFHEIPCELNSGFLVESKYSRPCRVGSLTLSEVSLRPLLSFQAEKGPFPVLNLSAVFYRGNSQKPNGLGVHKIQPEVGWGFQINPSLHSFLSSFCSGLPCNPFCCIAFRLDFAAPFNHIQVLLLCSPPPCKG